MYEGDSIEISLSGNAHATPKVANAIHLANAHLHKFAVLGDQPELEKALQGAGIVFTKAEAPVLMMDGMVLVFPDSVFEKNGKIKAELMEFLRGK
jgi:hypothetical protein